MAFPLWFGGPPDAADSSGGCSPGDAEPRRSRARESIERTDNEVSDAALVARIRAGDESAAEEVFHAHFDSLVRYARRFSGSFDAAEDLAQDALVDFIEQQRAGGTSEMPRSIAALLRTMTRRRAINLWNRERRIARVHEELSAGDDRAGYVGASAGDAGEAPDVAVDRAEVVAAVRRAFDMLPPRARLIATMRWGDQRSRQEIAAELGVSVRTVDAQLYLAADRIRRILAPFR